MPAGEVLSAFRSIMAAYGGAGVTGDVLMLFKMSEMRSFCYVNAHDAALSM